MSNATMTSTTAPRAATATATAPRRVRATAGGRRAAGGFFSTAVPLIGAVYCFFPVLWIYIAATKDQAHLFSTSPYAISDGLGTNLTKLFAYGGGVFWQWAANTGLYALVGGLLVTLISACCGFALAKYDFAGRSLIFRALVAGVLLPQIVLAIPMYLMFSKIGLSNSYLSVLLPLLISPYAIYLSRIYAEASVPDELMEAARLDGARELRIFWSVGLRLMTPCLITVFLLQFIAIWNNYLLPLIMLSDPAKFPLTVGLNTMMTTAGSSSEPQQALVITGAAISILPVVALFLLLQRFWRIDLVSGSLKS